MSKTRENHYVPQWYQRDFFEDDGDGLFYLDTCPDRIDLPNGNSVLGRSEFLSHPARWFVEHDLYSTFFGSQVYDEIERFLFGEIDAQGSKAVRAFAATNEIEWHRHFEMLFRFLDIQRLRTPKGLDWLRSNYPYLNQNELMAEMLGLRAINCSTWAEGVREIVSAEEAEVKFIFSDHPVTIYNHAVPLSGPQNKYPNDPWIGLRGSQTIFPLNRSFCLILTNLEYAKNPETDPLRKRTGAKNYRNSMTRTDALIRSRLLTTKEVIRINHVIKSRARRYIAAGNKEWLYPEQQINTKWSQLRDTLLPPSNELFQFGGEIIAKFDDGRVHWQDAYGRTEPEWDRLKKVGSNKLRSRDLCGCGSEKKYVDCCKSIPLSRRPTWSELSIRERNCALLEAINNILEIESKGDWIQVRRDLTDEQIAKVYTVFGALWPRETNLLSLLPKPDGRPRAVYSGLIHPDVILQFAVGSGLYFGEVLIAHPFVHPQSLNPEFSPTENPQMYRQEFLKAVVCFTRMMPLVETGQVILYPDPWEFDTHLRDTTVAMATQRSRFSNLDPSDDPRLKLITEADFQRTMLALPTSSLLAKIERAALDAPSIPPKDFLEYLNKIKEDDPLAPLQDVMSDGDERGGQLLPMKLTPNYEMALYLAQATGSSIITDSPYRWNEMKLSVASRTAGWRSHLDDLRTKMETSRYIFPWNPLEIAELALRDDTAGMPSLMRVLHRYLSRVDKRGRKSNREKQLVARFGRDHATTLRDAQNATSTSYARLSCMFPVGGIQSNTVNRLLLMSSSEHHMQSVPMAFFIEQSEPKRS